MTSETRRLDNNEAKARERRRRDALRDRWLCVNDSTIFALLSALGFGKVLETGDEEEIEAVVDAYLKEHTASVIADLRDTDLREQLLAELRLATKSWRQR
jgi:hypothetical protein